MPEKGKINDSNNNTCWLSNNYYYSDITIAKDNNGDVHGSTVLIIVVVVVVSWTMLNVRITQPVDSKLISHLALQKSVFQPTVTKFNKLE